MRFKLTAVLAVYLFVVLPAVGQDSGAFGKFVVKFNSATYDDPAFSALFPTGDVEVDKQTVGGREISRYSVFRGGDSGPDHFLYFAVRYWDVPTAEAPANNAIYLDEQLDLFKGTGGGRADSKLGGMFARSSFGNMGLDAPPSYEQYNRVTVKGRRVWWVVVKCQDPWFDSCTETDANKFFDSIKIK
jgi:hypothetical protein